MVMCVLGIATAMFLEQAWERTILSLCYSVLFVASSMNQGLIDKAWHDLDFSMALAILMLNIYFWGLAMSWWQYAVGGSFILYFLMSFAVHATLTVHWYEIHTNVWHMGVILMIYLVPMTLEQKNLF